MKKLCGITILLMFMLSSVCFASLTDAVTDNSNKPKVGVIKLTYSEIYTDSEVQDEIVKDIDAKMNNNGYVYIPYAKLRPALLDFASRNNLNAWKFSRDRIIEMLNPQLCWGE